MPGEGMRAETAFAENLGVDKHAGVVISLAAACHIALHRKDITDLLDSGFVVAEFLHQPRVTAETGQPLQPNPSIVSRTSAEVLVIEHSDAKLVITQ